MAQCLLAGTTGRNGRLGGRHEQNVPNWPFNVPD
jgi:hypothetical protein